MIKSWMFKPQEEGGLPLTGWTYRKSITLSRASGAVTNYQMKLLLGESSGATGEDVDCGGNCLSSFNDIRFTASDGTTLLDYWIESISGTTPNQLATIWIEFDSIGTGATTFYMYYGNAGAAAASSGANTFIQYHGSSTVSFHDSDVTPTTGGLRYRARARWINSVGCNVLFGLASDGYTLSDDYTCVQYYKGDGKSYFKTANNATLSFTNETIVTDDGVYRILEINFVFGVSSIGYINGEQIGSTLTTNLPNEAMGLFMDEEVGSGEQEWSFVSQYLATEPAWGSWGSEES